MTSSSFFQYSSIAFNTAKLIMTYFRASFCDLVCCRLRIFAQLLCDWSIFGTNYSDWMEKDSCDADWVIRSYLSRFEIVPERSNPSDWIEKDDNGTWYRYAVDLLVPDRNLMELLVVGIAAIDIIHEVAQYPEGICS
jgi:hypothetical protein